MSSIRSLARVVRELAAILPVKHKRRGILVCVNMFVLACIETLGISCIIPFVTAIIEPDSFIENIYIANMMNFLGIDGIIGMQIMLAVGVFFIYLFKNVLLLLGRHIQNLYQYNVKQDLSIDMLMSYVKRPYSHFLEINPATVQRSLINDINGVIATVQGLLTLLSETLTMGLIILFLLYSDVWMTVEIGLIAIGCIVFFVMGLKKYIYRKGHIYRESEELIYKYVYQMVNGIKEIHVLQREEEFLKQYSDTYTKKKRAESSYFAVMLLPERVIEIAFVLAILVIVCVKFLNNANASEYLPQLAAFAVAAFRLLPSVNKITTCLNQIAFSREMLVSTYENMEEGKKISNIALQGNVECEVEFKHKIEVKGVSWKYNSGHDYVLKDLNIVINKGEAVALIGSSGAGKTTLADILLGLLRPEIGEIKVDGVDIASIPSRWAKMVGYVPQSVYLLDETIRDNVAFGLARDTIDDALIWKSLEDADLKEFVERLPEKLDTFVGDRGVRLSGGQRQRVAIARALYHEPEILVLDEATSSLDNETEKVIMESIDFLHGQKTLIIVAHRLSTIKNCDKVYEIKDGKAYLRDKMEVLEG